MLTARDRGRVPGPGVSRALESLVLRTGWLKAGVACDMQDFQIQVGEQLRVCLFCDFPSPRACKAGNGRVLHTGFAVPSPLCLWVACLDSALCNFRQEAFSL